MHNTINPNATGGIPSELTPKLPSTQEHTHASNLHNGMSRRSPKTIKIALNMNFSIVIVPVPSSRWRV